MRKYLIGFLVGVLLTFTTTAFAEDLSKIGKKITAEFTVLLDGDELPVKAIAFEGTSYAPVRAIGEALGLDVDFKDGLVLLDSKSVPVEEVAEEVAEETRDVQIKRLEEELRVLVERDIPSVTDVISLNKHSLERVKTIEADQDIRERNINEYENRLLNLEDTLSGLLNRKQQIENEIQELQAAE